MTSGAHSRTTTRAPATGTLPALAICWTGILTKGPDRRHDHGQPDRQQGQAAARGVALNVLATVQSTVGTLDRVVRIVKVLGMVNVAPGFTDTPQVINGFSDFMVEVFGKERALAARSAVGMAALPLNIPAEIESIFEVRP